MKFFLLKNNKYFSNLFILIILLFISFPLLILSQTNQNQISTISKKELYNGINKYNQTNAKLDKLLPTFQKIKFNFIIKLSFWKLIHMKNKIDNEIIDIQKKIDKNKDIGRLSENLKKYERKYNQLIDMYNRFENIKKSVKNFIIIFFISIFTGIIIFAIFLTFITIIVMKRQKKYYKLHEEVTLEDGREVNIKNDIKDKTSRTTFRNIIKKDLEYLFPKYYQKKSKH